MPSSMILHDRRLRGNPPQAMAANIYNVDQNIPIAHAFGWVAEYARRSGGLRDLFVMCHGCEDVLDYRHQRCVPEVHGGYGLELCREFLSLANVSETSVLSGKVTKITIFACSTADTAPYNRGTDGDGRRFCGQIAQLTRAEVIAAVQTQRYTHLPSIWQFLTGRNREGTIDFGSWEGPVYRFTPGNPNGRRIH